MLHVDVSSIDKENGARKWFVDRVKEARRMSQMGHRDWADGMNQVLQDFVALGNLEGTDTGDQMGRVTQALERAIGCQFDREMNQRAEEYANEGDESMDSALERWLYNTRN